MRRLNAQLERARDEAERRSRIDPVTGVANRRHFSELLAAAASGHEEAAVLLVDVDHFKQVNDAYGHGAGDDVLQQVCGRIRGAIRSADELARWGGEEFAVLVRGPIEERALRALGEGIRSALSEEVLLTDAGPVLVTVSVGAASARPLSSSPNQLLQAADRALYAAKRRGRNQVVLASELREDDLLVAEPEVVRLAHMLAIMTAAHEGMSARHPEQVADLAGRIAERLGASPAEVLRCRLAGWLHDIGTIAVPGEVLAKPAALDAAEWALVRSHPLSGQEMVASVSALADAALGVRHHHERLDGSGYPDGLREDEIPFEARVVAVADAYSAMTWERPFRRRRSSEEALDELRAGAPLRYDPEAVEALIATIDEERTRGGPRRGRRRVTDLA
jgi:diguanylate cyclase (GGDEF)-like protein